MKRTFERVWTFLWKCNSVQVFDEQVFARGVVMSAVDFGLEIDSENGSIWSATEGRPVATVRDIRSAPSLRSAALLEEKREASKRIHPAYRMRAQSLTATQTPVPTLAQATSLKRSQTFSSRVAPSFLIGMKYLIALIIVVGSGFALGVQLQPAAYSGPIWSHSVSAGESVWALADRVGSNRPLRDVVEDIRLLNDLSTDLLVPGQVVTLPVE